MYVIILSPPPPPSPHLLLLLLLLQTIFHFFWYFFPHPTTHTNLYNIYWWFHYIVRSNNRWIDRHQQQQQIRQTTIASCDAFITDGYVNESHENIIAINRFHPPHVNHINTSLQQSPTKYGKRLPIADCWLPITDYRSPVSISESPTHLTPPNDRQWQCNPSFVHLPTRHHWRLRQSFPIVHRRCVCYRASSTWGTGGNDYSRRKPCSS